MLRRIVTALFFLLLSLACGRLEEKAVKQYDMHFYSDNPRVLAIGRAFVAKFNQDAGITALTYTDNEAEANSFAALIPGLLSQSGDVAFGRAVQDKPPDNPLSRLRLKAQKITVHYAMRLEFDQDYFISGATQPEGSLSRRMLYVLFCHEVGHGLMMNDTYDDAQRHNIMYGTLASQDVLFKDFKGYFAQVRTFLQPSNG